MFPQIVFLVLCGMGLGAGISQHGQPRKNWDAGAIIVGTIVNLSLLYWGGFFACFFNR
jgi:hypothetical protein